MSMRSLLPKRQLLWMAVVLLLATIIVGWQLLVQPIIGLGDNGDFERLLIFGRCTHVAVPDGTRFFTHIHRLFECDERASWISYYSSQLLLIKLAVELASLLWKWGYFDLRILTVVQLPILLLAFAISLVALARRPFLDSVVVGVLLLLIFCDVGYVAYFNSFYSEPGSLLWLLLTISLSLFLVLREPLGIARLLTLGALFVAMALLVTAKAQNIPLGGPLALLLWRLGSVGPGMGPGMGTGNRLMRWLRASVLPLLLVGLCAVYFQVGRQDEIKRTNLYHHVFGELLPSSSDEAADLRAFGLPESYAALRGTNWFTAGIPKDDPQFVKTFYGKVSHRSILKFYLLRPGRLWSLCARNAYGAFELRPFLGNFEPSAHRPPMSRSFGYAKWSSLKHSLPAPAMMLLLVVLLHICVIVGKSLRFDRTTSDRLITELHATLLVCGGVAFGTILLGEGRGETVRYLMIVNALHDLALLFVVGYALAVIRRRSHASSGSLPGI